jgi:hypothetical protein
VSSIGQRSGRRRNTLYCVAISLLLGACTLEPGGPEYAQLSVYAENERGLVTDDACTMLPVLPGGLTVRELEFAGAFTAQLEAQRERLRLRFEGVREPEELSRQFSAERLHAGYAEEIRLETLDGDVFSVFLRAPCAEAP